MVLSSDHEMEKKENGTYVIKGLTTGDIVTVVLTRKDGEEDAADTGLWLNSTGNIYEGKNVENTQHMGNVFAFRVGSGNMKFKYCVTSREQSEPIVLRGQLVTATSSIFHPETRTLTPKNIKEYGLGVPNATVTLLTRNSEGSVTENGQTYYTTAVTDKNGNFALCYEKPDRAASQGRTFQLSVLSGSTTRQFSVVERDGIVAIELPYQDSVFQFDRATVGTGQLGDLLPLENANYRIAVHLTVEESRRAQSVKFRSYTAEGQLFKEWLGIKCTGEAAKNWSFETTVNTSQYFTEGGRATVEVYDENGVGQGEVNIGFSMETKPVGGTIRLPDFTPEETLNLPVLGEVNASLHFGSSTATPEKEDDFSKTGLSTGAKAQKNALEVVYGSGKAIKQAIKDAKGEDDYASADDSAKALMILAGLGTDDATAVVDKKTDKKDMGDAAWVKGGKGKNAVNFSYDLGVYIGMYTQPDQNGKVKYYFESMTLYAGLNFSAETTQQFSVMGIPLYIQLGGKLNGHLLLNAVPQNGGSIVIVDPTTKGYINKEILDQAHVGSACNFLITVTLGAGVGCPKILAAGVEGTLKMDIDYQPWDEGAGKAAFEFSATLSLVGVKVNYKIVQKTYKMFATDGYTGHKVDGLDKEGKSANSALLLDYDDGRSVTTVEASAGPIQRGDGGGWTPVGGARNGIALMAEPGGIGGTTLENRNVLHTITPKLLPMAADGSTQRALLLMLVDDQARGVDDCSALYYAVVTLEEDGTLDFDSTKNGYLDTDGTFDSRFDAVTIGGGKTLVVWSDGQTVHGASSPTLSDAMNGMDLSYCVIGADGTPGDVKKLTNESGSCESMPKLAYDAQTGNTIVAYTATDYKTEGVTFDENNPAELDQLGNFIYNSYSTVCYKILDENGNIVTEYGSGELNYADYEEETGESLNGLRFLDTQLSDRQVQSTIDELTVAARSGVGYFVYSLDTDRDNATDADRELYLVNLDFATGETTDPFPLTNNLTVDNNPQLVLYQDHVQLFWNCDGIITSADLTMGTDIDLPSNDLGALGEPLQGMDGAAQTFLATVQPDGCLYLLWSAWAGEPDENGGNEDGLYMVGYDPDFVYTDEEGNELGRGGWGQPSLLTTASGGSSEVVPDEPAPGRDLSEQTVLSTGELILMAYKASEGGTNALGLQAFKPSTSVFLDAETIPAYPAPGEETALDVSGTNYGPLPAEGVTIHAKLVTKDNGTLVQDLGEQTINQHVQSGGSIYANFTFTMPENPENCDFYLEAAEDLAADEPTSLQMPLPWGPSVSIQDTDVENGQEDLSYRFGLELRNDGNAALTGAKLLLERAPANWQDLDDTAGYREVVHMDVPEVSADGRVYLAQDFDLTEPDFDENGRAELRLSVLDSEGTLLAADTFYLNKPEYEDGTLTGIAVMAAEHDAFSVRSGDSRSLEVTAVPLAARNGYYYTYSVANPAVASVDAAGIVTGLSTGTTQLTITARNNGNAVFVNQDGLAFNAAGEPVIFDENGLPTNLGGGAADAEVMSKTVTVNVTNSGSSSSGSGGSTGTTTKNPDGSTTTTVTRPDGTVVETTKGKDGSQAVVENKKDGSVKQTSTTADGVKAESATTAGGKYTAQVTIPEKAVKDEKTPIALPILPVKAEQAVEKAPVITITAPKDKTVKVEVPVTGVKPGTVAVRVLPDGTEQIIKTCVPTEQGLALAVSGEATIKIVDNTKTFGDVAAGNWAADSVSFVTAREIFNGTGAGTFSPDLPMTRAMLMTVLARTDGQDTAAPEGGQWYDAGTKWAVEQGISDGTNPDGSITREQLATMLWRYAGSPATNGTLDGFTDADKTGNYATDALRWAVEQGIITGKGGGVLDPQGPATRAEVSAMLMRYLDRLS